MLCKPRPNSNELKRVAIGYKNALCLTRAKQAQPALYNGHEIIKENHIQAIVHNSEDTLEIAEITRKKMNDKMNDPECVTHKVKIAPHDYSKDNLLATFTPQKQLTPEQIFWSNNLMKLKSEALKERTKVSKPIKAFTVYPPNTPAALVPKVLPTKSQVKILIFTLIQQFSEFDQTCKKRITPSAITDGERGFEQTKACYLQEDVFEELEAEVAQHVVVRKHDAIELKNLLIANDNLIAECLSQEVFCVETNSELNAARFTDMHVANTTAETCCLALEPELANLHQIGNNPPTPDNDTPDFDSVFVIGKMQASLQGKDNVIRQLKKELSQLQVTHQDTDRTLRVQTTDSKITKLTDQITRAKHIEHVTKLTTENMNLKTGVSKATVNPLVSTRDKHAIDVEPIVLRLRNNRNAHLDYLMHLTESVETIHNIVEKAKVVRPLDRSIVSACRYTKHSQELLEYAIGTCPHGSQPRVDCCPIARGSQPMSHVKPNRISPAKGDTKIPIDDKPRKTSTLVLPHSTHHNCEVERKIKQVWKPKYVARIITQVWKLKLVGTLWKPTGKVLTTISHQWRPTGQILHLGTQCPLTRFTAPQVVVQIVLWYLDSGCSKHMTGDRSRLLNFVKKFIRTVRFENDHFGAIMGYGDYVVSESVISRVYYVEGLGHNLFSVGQFCDSDLEVAFRKHSCYVRDTNGVDLGGRLQTINGKKYILVIVDDYSRFTWVKFLRSKDETPEVVIKFITQIQVSLNKTVRYVRTDNGTEFVNHTMTEYYERIGIFHQKSVPKTPQQNGVVERQNRTLVEVARTMLIFSKALMFLWAEVVATACYTQNRSLIHTRHHKTPYELVHNKKPDLTFFRVFGALCYPTNDSEDLGKLQPTADTRIFVGYAPSRKGYRIYNKRTQRIMETIYVQFDELTEPMAPLHLQPPRAERPDSPAQAVQVSVSSAGIPLSTTIDQDAPSPHISSSSSALKSHSLPPGVIAEPYFMEDHTVSPVDTNPFVNVFAPEPHSEASSSRDISSTESPYVSQTLHHLNKWSKDHPLDNVIGNPSRPVSTQKQLATDALWCLYNSVLSKIEPKNFKSAIIEDCWFQAMQYEIHEFDRLQVWELVPQPDCVMIIALKWIYKVKLDEYGDVLKNKVLS
nr:retrovirus-related Pol polyprotein from transposon TNT 1-94 [Tanacetum cinerariifolium]